MTTDTDPTPPHGIERPPGPKHPEIEVELTGRDGNAFAIMGAVQRAMRQARLDSSEIDDYRNEAMSGDYDHLLVTTMKWVTVL